MAIKILIIKDFNDFIDSHSNFPSLIFQLQRETEFHLKLEGYVLLKYLMVISFYIVAIF